MRRAAGLTQAGLTQAGLTQAGLARRAGTSQPVVSAYEHDLRDPSVSTLRRLIGAAGARLELRTAGLAVSGQAAPGAASERDRGERLVDVLLLADAIPTRRRRRELTFPRIASR